VVDESNIRFGLSAIKNLGSDVVSIIIEQRKASGQFASIEDFVRRVQTRNFNKKSWEALAKSGAFDSLGERNQLLANTEGILEFAKALGKTDDQASLFGKELMPVSKLKLREVEPASKKEKLTWEKELLGLYVSSHPMEEYAERLKKITHPIKVVIENKIGNTTLGGIITRVQKILTKKGDQMAFIDLEDLTGTIEVIVFPNLFSKFTNLIVDGKIVLVTGKLSDKDGEPKFLADDMREFGQTSIPQEPVSVTIKIPEAATDELFGQLKQLFESAPGEMSVNLMIKEQKVKTPFRINLDDELKLKIKQLLG
jgi:DNA polymerase-3 subunit alpha